MTIEDWLQEKKALFGGDRHVLSKGSRILDVWWDLAEKDPALRAEMKTGAEKILNEREPGKEEK